MSPADIIGSGALTAVEIGLQSTFCKNQVDFGQDSEMNARFMAECFC